MGFFLFFTDFFENIFWSCVTTFVNYECLNKFRLIYDQIGSSFARANLLRQYLLFLTVVYFGNLACDIFHFITFFLIVFLILQCTWIIFLNFRTYCFPWQLLCYFLFVTKESVFFVYLICFSHNVRCSIQVKPLFVLFSHKLIIHFLLIFYSTCLIKLIWSPSMTL